MLVGALVLVNEYKAEPVYHFLDGSEFKGCLPESMRVFKITGETPAGGRIYKIFNIQDGTYKEDLMRPWELHTKLAVRYSGDLKLSWT